MKYDVKIKYTEIYYVRVEADNPKKAEEKAFDLYDNGNCSLDYFDVTVTVEDEHVEDTDA